MKTDLLMILVLSTFLSYSSCKQNAGPEVVGETTNEKIATMCSENAVKSVYYWKTLFKLSDWDKEFLAKHDIKRIYLRLFDVDYGWDNYNVGEGRIEISVPIATLRFESDIPEGIEIVPVVYITHEAISRDPNFSDQLYERITKMAKKHGFSNFRELQLDCDWSKSTEQKFFELCDEMRDKLHTDGRELSATIRLHQLSKDAPPVDRGVLMVYNTGSLYDSSTENSILSYSDVEAYLGTYLTYDLPLSCAFPVFSWGILMDGKSKFRSILHKTDYSDNTLYKYIAGNYYRVIKSHDLENHYIKEGNIIRYEKTDFSLINKVKRLVTLAIHTDIDGVILYNLDSLEMSRFTEKEIDAILM